MVMMENYEMKSPKFLPAGKIAIGIKYTRDGIEIVENLQSIGYAFRKASRKDAKSKLKFSSQIQELLNKHSEDD